ncbi:ubiquitin carboxyl-terminal hydrolase-like isoform X2 [Dreissena polymorpha]|uniref:ubiquitin carboxyl-terminal hydrolase-like isoform X2 n=1 Tax=Dreissena polymorpha TaxID=45954 RepID=UPI00226429BA|nr:ubiquitin carboxyl-terminal hydrolase-like isoform X2 [Dreissena polymorpha]
MSGDKKQRWVPLESNPEYIHNLGVPKHWEFVDVYGLDPELLMMVPQPVVAVMLLYPITDQSEAEENKLGEEQSDVDGVYYMKQTVGNACGTVAVIHALANNRDNINFSDNKHFNKFLEETVGKAPDEIANILENDEAMGAAHDDSAQEGQTEAPSRDDKINTHFIAFVCRKDGLYELDGRKNGPVFHGKTSADSLLEDSIEVVRQFMARDPAELNFTLMALVNNS